MLTKKSVIKMLQKLDFDLDSISHIPINEIRKGIEHEFEHLTNKNDKLNLKVKNKKLTALKIALVHLTEVNDYYSRLNEIGL